MTENLQTWEEEKTVDHAELNSNVCDNKKKQCQCSHDFNAKSHALNALLL